MIDLGLKEGGGISGWDRLLRNGIRSLTALEGLEETHPFSRPAETCGRAVLDGSVRYGTSELACLHEAGHAAVALQGGVRVLEMKLDLSRSTPGGCTRTLNANIQRPLIALGGFALELRLWEQDRLFWFDGSRPSEREMVRGAANSSHDDRVMYFGTSLRGPDGRWPLELDERFYRASQSLAAAIDMGVVTRIARALFEGRYLRERAILRASLSAEL